MTNIAKEDKQMINRALIALAFIGWTAGGVHAQAPSISIVDSATPSEELPVKPGVYIGQKITFEDTHSGNLVARVGVWEAGISKTYLEDYPFTEYVLMISGHVVITNDDGTENSFKAGDTFVIPKGFSGIWDVREHMKKQMVQVGDPTARTTSRPVSD
ncbi:cupin domain-containing protein [Roseobacter litoralis]|uniref:cupin domain-containing protein n=1 Tax=Roseobacter litoralis TaxID=42443 RepID=UPI002494BCD2|nr:cupin domain-containing protein [Roseobacter litoralis]